MVDDHRVRLMDVPVHKRVHHRLPHGQIREVLDLKLLAGGERHGGEVPACVHQPQDFQVGQRQGHVEPFHRSGLTTWGVPVEVHDGVRGRSAQQDLTGTGELPTVRHTERGQQIGCAELSVTTTKICK